MANQREMNTWGARPETIEILKWGDPQESLQFLRRHQDYRHIKRMVLELEGREKEAASLGNHAQLIAMRQLSRLRSSACWNTNAIQSRYWAVSQQVTAKALALNEPCASGELHGANHFSRLDH